LADAVNFNPATISPAMPELTYDLPAGTEVEVVVRELRAVYPERNEVESQGW